MIGRECPAPKCESYFKLQLGTGLKGENLPCHCPYCGHTAPPNQFFTKAQIEYAKSVVLNQVMGAFLKDLKSLEFDHRPQGGFGIGVSLKVTGQSTPIRYYREKKLETEVVCDQCTFRYMIYGVFGFCPDCRVHNSLQILTKNLELVEKLIAVAETQESAVADNLISNALEDCVSAFDGFGRETCRVFSLRASVPKVAEHLRFQNIVAARAGVLKQFNTDFARTLPAVEWAMVSDCFQKRHLLAHKMGVIDDDYVKATGGPSTSIGRKVKIDGKEVLRLSAALKILGAQLSADLRGSSS